MNLLQTVTNFHLSNEIVKTLLSFTSGIILLLIGRVVLASRDRKIQELDRKRALLDELRHDFIRIENNYYKIRKRYTTMFDAVRGNPRRNPYILEMKEKQPEKFDFLLIECISLEAEYYTLMERLKISFPLLWNEKLVHLMEKKDRTKKEEHPKANEKVLEKEDNSKAGEQVVVDGNSPGTDRHALEKYFDKIRDSIERKEDIDNEISKPMENRFLEILKEFNEYEPQLLVGGKNKW